MIETDQKVYLSTLFSNSLQGGANFGALPNSEKIYYTTTYSNNYTNNQLDKDIANINPHKQNSSNNEILRMQVPSRQVKLNDGRKIDLYDTSGPYSESDFNNTFNPQTGLPTVRTHLDHSTANHLSNTEYKTQLHNARKGIITPEMYYIAQREAQLIRDIPAFQSWFNTKFNGNGFNTSIPTKLTAEFIRNEVAQGRAVIPSNKQHKALEPMIIGRSFLVKVNVNINLINNIDKIDNTEHSLADSLINETIWATRWGADVITLPKFEFQNLDNLVKNSPVPIAVDPMFEALNQVNADIGLLNWETYKENLIQCAKSGVDIIIIHAGMRQEHLPGISKRLSGVLSDSAQILYDWMNFHKLENFIADNFEELCEIIAEYDITLSIDSALRPDCIADANDVIQRSEVAYLGEMAEIAWSKDIQVMIEGPSNLPMHMIHDYMNTQIACCQEVPFYTKNPSVTDSAVGHQHCSAVIGAAMIGWHGCAMLSFNLSNSDTKNNNVNRMNIKNGIMAYKIAAHCADLSKGHPRAWMRDYLIAEAKYKLNWEDLFSLSLDPEYSAYNNAENTQTVW